MTAPALHHGRDLAKRATRTALDVVIACTVQRVADMAAVSYATLYAYADLGTARARGVREGGRPARKNSPSPERMREIAAAIRQQGGALLDAAQELEAAAAQVEASASDP